MAFTFTRVDGRAIHGQTVTLWSKIYSNNGILLIDDEIALDPMMRQIYKNAAVGMSVFIYNQQDALIKAKQASESLKNYLLIVRSPLVLEFLEKNGIDVGKKITLGPVAQNEKRRPISQFTALSIEEIASCDYLASLGKEVIFQSIPSTAVVRWESIKK
ncbi:MAG: PTS sugar transporter subunit IIB [Erysipelotrichaceae bacterium]|nr:PTS sugar transporter subunit IIB [Erysipelotrichaceae bacterium]